MTQETAARQLPPVVAIACFWTRRCPARKKYKPRWQAKRTATHSSRIARPLRPHSRDGKQNAPCQSAYLKIPNFEKASKPRSPTRSNNCRALIASRIMLWKHDGNTRRALSTRAAKAAPDGRDGRPRRRFARPLNYRLIKIEQTLQHRKTPKTRSLAENEDGGLGR